MGAPALIYRDETWDVALPTVRSYMFSQEDIFAFIHGAAKVPFVFDTNLPSGCNVNCVYCATRGGKSDARFMPTDVPHLTDGQIIAAMQQFGELGLRTFFICSNGEPLLRPERVLHLIDAAASPVSYITYTNGSTLDRKTLEELHKRNVSIIMKLESFDAEKNDGMILNVGDRRKRSFEGYKYARIGGKTVPSHIIDAFDVYGGDSDMLGLETMITKQNADEVLEMREWAYDVLGCAQFLKQLYPLGYAQSRQDLVLNQEEKDDIHGRIQKFDETRGFKYPGVPTNDHFSYDARRLMNNIVSATGMPFRMFGHERGGIYHSSQIVKTPFGFGTSRLVGFVQNGEVDVNRYLTAVIEIIREQREVA